MGNSSAKPQPSHAGGRLTPNLHVLMTVTIVLLVCIIIFQRWSTKLLYYDHTGVSEVGLEPYRSEHRLGYAPNRFLSEDNVEADEAWENIQAGHGVVILDASWSAQHQIKETIKYPADTSKGLYVVAAYHDLHCVQVVRRHYRALLEGRPATWSLHHDMHCFDALRQSIMCHADDTLFQSTGNRDAGHNQIRRCKNWDKLREWATKHTACYADHDLELNKDLWGQCDGGDDGLPHRSLLSE